MPTDASAILYDVFISYARRDANLGAAPLDSALKRDFRVWRDTRDLPPEQDFTAEIEKAIKAAARLVVCVTPDVEREDSFVRREIAYAQLLKKPLLVARFADVIPPIHVVNHTWIDFFRDWDTSLAKLLRWLRGEPVDSAAPAGAATSVPAADPYRAYVERLYADVVESLRVSVFSTEAITLRAVESPGDVPRKPTPRINPKFLTTALREPPQPAPTVPAEFASLHEAYASAGCDGRVLLLGEPGAGKTTSLLAFARDAAAARLSDVTQPLPVFARISGWDSQAQTPLADWITTGETDLPTDDLSKLIDDGSALLLLDGLDELGERRPVEPSQPDGENYDPRERFLKLLPSSGKLILSSRLEEYRQIEEQADLSCAVRLQRLDDAQMEDYLADLPDLWAVLQADSDLKEALRTPLLLALFRVGFEEAPEDARALGSLSAGELNERIWDVFIDRRWAFEQARRHEVLPFSAKELKMLLGHAAAEALHKFRINDGRFLTEDIDSSDANQIISLAQELNLIQSTGTLLILNYSVKTYRFLHLRLRDALVFPIAFTHLFANDSDLLDRISSIDWLTRSGDSRAVEVLVTALHDLDETARVMVAGSIGNLQDVRVVQALIDALDDQDERVRENAIYSLGSLNVQEAVVSLIEALQDQERRVRISAIQVLGDLGDTHAINPIISTLRDSDVFVREHVVNALEKLGTAAVEPLIEALCDPDNNVRRYVVEALGRLGDERAVAPLVTALNDPEENVWHHAVTALRNLGTKAFAALDATLRDNELPARSRARVASILGDLGDVRALSSLIVVLGDRNLHVRNNAAEALGKLGDARALASLLIVLRDPRFSIQDTAADALGNLGDKRAVEPLIAVLGDPHFYPRNRAAYALGTLGDNRAIEPLINALRDTYEDVRESAANALEKFPNDERARTALADFYAGKIEPRDEL